MWKNVVIRTLFSRKFYVQVFMLIAEGIVIYSSPDIAIADLAVALYGMIIAWMASIAWEDAHSPVYTVEDRSLYEVFAMLFRDQTAMLAIGSVVLTLVGFFNGVIDAETAGTGIAAAAVAVMGAIGIRDGNAPSPTP